MALTSTFQSAKRICAVSKASNRPGAGGDRKVSIRQADLCCFEGPTVCPPRRNSIVSIRQADLCCFEARRGEQLRAAPSGVSIRQADLCCFEVSRVICSSWRRRFQSAKRICAVSKCPSAATYGSAQLFQSAKRICAVSKAIAIASGGMWMDVSIRQADLCCFEASWSCCLRCPSSSFNPPSGFVLFRRTPGRSASAHRRGFNPPSGFVLFRRMAHLDNPLRHRCFNPPSGFVLFRS